MLISALLHKILKCLLLHQFFRYCSDFIILTSVPFMTVSGLYKKLGIGFPIPNSSSLITKDDV